VADLSVGDSDAPFLDVAPYDPIGTTVTLTLHSPADLDPLIGTDIPLAAGVEMSGVDGPFLRVAVASPVQYPAAGWWVRHWTVTGVGAGVEDDRFYVAASPVAAAPINADPTTDVGMTRLLCTDVNATAPIFTDDQIAAFLTLEGSVRLGAAVALETIASCEALISKKIRTEDGLSTDGPAVAAELRARAKTLREQAAAAGEGDVGFAFDIVPAWTPYGCDGELAEWPVC
jgi:hypothetical protein